MRGVLRFVTTRFIGGLLILLTLLLTYLMVGQMFDLLLVLTVPITDILPENAFPDIWEHWLAAAAILIALCLLTGLMMETQASKEIGHWIETRVLNRFPPYAVLRSLSMHHMTDALGCILNWGTGTEALIRARAESQRQNSDPANPGSHHD